MKSEHNDDSTNRTLVTGESKPATDIAQSVIQEHKESISLQYAMGLLDEDLADYFREKFTLYHNENIAFRTPQILYALLTYTDSPNLCSVFNSCQTVNGELLGTHMKRKCAKTDIEYRRNGTPYSKESETEFISLVQTAYGQPRRLYESNLVKSYRLCYALLCDENRSTVFYIRQVLGDDTKFNLLKNWVLEERTGSIGI